MWGDGGFVTSYVRDSTSFSETPPGAVTHFEVGSWSCAVKLRLPSELGKDQSSQKSHIFRVGRTRFSHFASLINKDQKMWIPETSYEENSVCLKSRYVELKGFAGKLSAFRLWRCGQTASRGLPHWKLSARALLASIIEGVAKCQGPPLLGVNPQILSCQRLLILTNCNLQGTPLPLTHI